MLMKTIAFCFLLSYYHACSALSRQGDAVLKKSALPFSIVIALTLVAIFFLKQNSDLGFVKDNLDTVNRFYFDLDLAKTETVLNKLLASKVVSPETQADALVFQAKIAWKFYRDAQIARDKLSQADGLGVNAFAVQAMRSRVERESSDYKRAIKSAEKALHLAQSEIERLEGTICLGQAIWEETLSRIVAQEDPDQELLKNGMEVLQERLMRTPGYPKPTKLLLGLALLAQDGETAFGAWKSYFQVQDDDPPQGLLAKPYHQLKALLPGWQQRPLTHEEGACLIEALGQSRFYDFARQVKQVFFLKDSFADHPSVGDMLLYADFIERVKQVTDEYYRNISLGQEDEKAYQDSLFKQAETLWQNLTFSGERPAFSKERFAQEMKQRFAVHISVGSTGNYSGTVLIMGHLIDEQRRKVEQYGYSSDFGFLLYDMMVSNGYSSWFWDGMANIGGWGTADTIAMVRSGSVERQYRKWWRVHDINERQKQAEYIADRADIEEKEIAQNSSASLNALTARMEQIALDKMAAAIESSGLAAEEIPMTFLRQYNQFIVGSAVFAHEGRHAIDQKYFPREFADWSSSEREFRAKLSEIVFSSNPYLALAGLLNQGVNDSGHGQANLKIRTVLTEWMENHATEIENLDPKRPFLTQAHLLTDNQIRACFTQADPLSTQK